MAREPGRGGRLLFALAAGLFLSGLWVATWPRPPSHAPLYAGGTGRGIPARPSGEALALAVDAEVRYGLGRFEIRNRGDWDWRHVTLAVEARDGGSYTLAVGRMDAGATYTAPAGLFADRARRLDPLRVRPVAFSVSCSDRDGKQGWYRGLWDAEDAAAAR